MTPPEPPSRSQVSKLAKSFADNTSLLSDFLIWFLYHDIIELPESPEIWYAPLSTYLSQTQAVGAGYGLELVVLDSICDRLYIHRSIVYGILIKFASPKKIAFSVLSTIV